MSDELNRVGSVNIEGSGGFDFEKFKDLLEKRFKEAMGELCQEDLLKTSSDSTSEKWKEEIKQFKYNVNKEIEEGILSRRAWGEPVIVIARDDGVRMTPVMTTTLDELSIQLQDALDNFKLASLSDSFEKLSSLATPSDEEPQLTDSQIRKMLKYEKNPMRIKQLNKMLSGKRKRG